VRRNAQMVLFGEVDEPRLLTALRTPWLTLETQFEIAHAGLIIESEPAMLTGQSAIVTGASRGLGRAIALRLAADGAAVCVNYHSSGSKAEDVVREIEAAGGRAIALRADIGHAAEAETLVERTCNEFGSVSILVNNAGLAYRATLDTFDIGAMERMRRTNVDGLIHVTRFCAPRMKGQRYGRIINMTSVSGFGTSMAGNAFYGATKAAVSLMTKRFAMELGPHGITVNAVAPGFILTDMVRDGRTSDEYEAVLARVKSTTMVGRTGEPSDIANAVAFLAAPAASFITAQILTVDGGRMDYITHG
jgi:3-oxoacyl-[acyl-carrier protein] reductase